MYKFSCHDIILLQEGFTHINIWIIVKNLEKLYYFKKKIFCIHLNIENITDSDYTHAKKSL